MALMLNQFNGAQPKPVGPVLFALAKYPHFGSGQVATRMPGINDLVWINLIEIINDLQV